MTTIIIDRGRGPEIAGTRITVYDILDHLQANWHHTRIATFLRLSSAQVLAAVEYIETHKAEVLADYQRMLERSAQGNPPAAQALVDQAHARFQAKVRRWQEAKERNGADASDLG